MHTPDDPGSGARAVPARTASPRPDEADAESAPEYEELLRTAHAAWDALDESGDRSAQVSPSVLAAIKRAVRAEVRHGAQIEVPPTPRGPYTVSELSLRTLLREAVDAVPGARGLRTRVEHADPAGDGGRGLPVAVVCRISAAQDTPDLPALAERVRDEIAATLSVELGLDVPRIDIHIEDLHEH